MKTIFDTYGSVILSILGCVFGLGLILLSLSKVEPVMTAQLSSMDATASDTWVITTEAASGGGTSDNAEIAALGRRMDELEADYQAKNAELNNKINAAQEDIISTNTNIDTIKSNVTAIENDISSKAHKVTFSYMKNPAYVTKSGNTVTLSAYSNLSTSLTAGTAYTLGTLPEGYRPAYTGSTYMTCGYYTIFCYITSAGTVTITPSVSLSASNWVGCDITFVTPN